MIEPVTEALHAAVSRVPLSPPACPVISTVTGAPLTPDIACDPAYWARQARACVDFQAAVQAVPGTGSPVFVEVGPGRTLSAFVAQTLPRSSHRGVFHSLPDHARSVSDEHMMAVAGSNLWSVGVALDWARSGPRGVRKVALPSYPFQRTRCWVDPPLHAAAPAVAAARPANSDAPIAPEPERPAMPVQTAEASNRRDRLISDLAALLADMSGEEIGASDADLSFLEMGFDSLFMGQVSQAIARDYKVEIGFRRLLSDLSCLTELAAHLDAEMPADSAPVAQAAPAVATVVVPSAEVPALPADLSAGVEGVVQAQLQAMQAVFAQQLQALGGAGGAAPQAGTASAAPHTTPSPPAQQRIEASALPVAEQAQSFKVGRGPSVTGGTLTDAQVAFARDLAARYSARFPKSKAYTARHRDVLADPRTAAGFRAEWKELTFPVVAERSKGARIQDIDGHDFVDLVNGFGQTAFGHSPDFVIDAVAAQMSRGFPIGPQADLAGPVARKFAEWVGHERVTFCNTGSEAVMAAMRVARTVTGRDHIVVFDRDYHGQFDEVLVKGKARGGGDPAALPIAPGIPRSGLKNMVVLRYGAPEALEWIRAHIHEVAAVIVEPVQSRHPAHRPEGFVRDLRTITREGGAALVIDEVVTGFRTHRRGMQGVWGIQGDMATYGKVVGGGMPIGVLAGDSRFMDALDGGAWAFGDDSRPEAVPTFFAGTFVRHPLVLAAVDATLDHMAHHGEELWVDTAARTAELAAGLSAAMRARGLPDLIETYSSWFVINVTEADPRATLLYPLMRLEGVHVMDGFCGFLTTEHGPEDCERVLRAFEHALDALLSVGILEALRDGPAQAPAGHPAEDIPRTGLPLTDSQREIWMSHQMGGAAAAAFNESGSLWLEGTLDLAALQGAWDDLIARHDALRLRFARDGSTFDVCDPGSLPLMHVDLTADADAQSALDALIADEGARAIDITAEPPLRAHLVAMGADRHVLVFTVHHIVADGWSFGVMLDDLAALYAARVAGGTADLPVAPSFASHARASAAAGAGEKTLAFWREQYATVPALPELPGDRPPRPGRKSHAGGTVFHEIGGDLLTTARKAGAKQGCTLFATTFAAMQILVHRLSGASDIVLGVPTAAQQQMPEPNLVGHCVNLLPVRAPIAPGATVADHLACVRDCLMAAFDHQDITFGTIVQALKVPRQIDRLPLTEIEFNLEKDGAVPGMPGLAAHFRPNAKRAVTFDLFFNLCETTRGLRIDAHYNADLFDADTVRGWTRAYESILAAMVADAAAPVSRLPLSSDQGNDLPGFGATARDYDRQALLPDLVARAVAEWPAAVAVEDTNRCLTYGELAAKSDALAALIQQRVPGQGARVAVCLPRGAGLPVALLAVLKAGHAYVPLDPRQPAARLRNICDTAEVAAILTDAPETAGFAEADAPALILADEARAGDAPARVTVSPEAAAYVIFTSGSTGTPKGVAVPHRAVVNFLTSMAETPGLGPDDTLLAVTTVMFDISVLELFLPLVVGARVVIAPAEDVVSGFALVERLQRGDVTVMQATPTLWDIVLTAGFAPPAGLRMLCGGEPLPGDLAQRLTAHGAALWNMYGPTEATIWSAVKRIVPGAPITIGSPIANTDLLVLDEAGQVAPPGVVGELNIGGDGLALGYFNRPDLTGKVFRDVSVGGRNLRLYATGDLARRRTDGEIEILGRIDTQVKLRGFRIELGEIEIRLRAMPAIAKAAVDLRARGGDKQLVGYVVPDEGSRPDTAVLAAALATDLPDYMIPRAWVVLSDLPQTANGKLDRKPLPDPQDSASITPLRQVTDPETPIERRIADIWCAVLGVEAISVTDTLFALGIDSLAVFRIAARMLQDGLELEARHMFAHPTIRELAAFHDGRGDQPGRPTRPALSDFHRGARRTTGGSSA